MKPSASWCTNGWTTCVSIKNFSAMAVYHWTGAFPTLYTLSRHPPSFSALDEKAACWLLLTRARPFNCDRRDSDSFTEGAQAASTLWDNKREYGTVIQDTLKVRQKYFTVHWPFTNSGVQLRLLVWACTCYWDCYCNHTNQMNVTCH